MKIKKEVLLNSSPDFNYPSWLELVIEKITKDETGLDCVVYYKRHSGVRSFHFECKENHSAIIIGEIQEHRKTKAAIHFLRRQLPTPGSTRRPSLASYPGYEKGIKVDLAEKGNIEFIAEAFKCFMVDEPSAYPLSQSDKIKCSSVKGCWMHKTTTGVSYIFSGEILNIKNSGGRLSLLVLGKTNDGQAATHRFVFKDSQLHGPKPKRGHYLVYHPGQQTYVTSKSELKEFYAFADTELVKQLVTNKLPVETMVSDD